MSDKKSNYVKAVEAFKKLNLEDAKQAYEDIKEILRVDLENEKANLSQKRSDVEDLLESLK